MPLQTKIFRVFISSTFADMKLERNILQRNAFPRLEKFCEANGARFQAVDLRWGVNEASALDQKTLQICFKEVARCQMISPKPNFLVLLGDRYGWQPVPEWIPEVEMSSILAKTARNDEELVMRWYKLDKNALPPLFVLQPRERLTKGKLESDKDFKKREYDNWVVSETALRLILRKQVDDAGDAFDNKQRSKYFYSATHQEIIKGALNPPEDVESPEKHVFAFSRNTKGLPKDASARDFLDLTLDENPDVESKVKLDALKTELKDKLVECNIDQIPIIKRIENNETIQVYDLKEHYVNYGAKWENSELKVDNLQKFNDVIHDALKQVISEQLALVVDNDEIIREVKLHEVFKERLTKHFKGRRDILQTIDNYLNDHNKKKVMSIIGATGSGKSSVMAQAVKQNEKNGAILIYRFIGTTSGSTNGISLLQNLCRQIAGEYGITDVKTLAYEDDEKAWNDIKGLSEIFRKCLALSTAQKPLIIFLDSLDQLSETDNAKALYWLPRELSEHSRLVVSSLPELQDKLHATEMEQIPVLKVEEAKEILKKWFNFINRTLTQDQDALVIKSFNRCPSPLYLKLAFEKARKWHSYDKSHTLKEDVSGIINDYFDDLEIEHTEEFLRNSVCYILSGKYQGLAENEILEILAFDEDYWEIFTEKNPYHIKELTELKNELKNSEEGPRGYMKIPIAVWSRLYLDLEPFLTERDADGVPIITFFHREFNKVLIERYHL